MSHRSTLHSPIAKSLIKLLTIVSAVVVFFGMTFYVIVQADNAAQTLPFTQNWSNAGLITNDDVWNSAPGIIGYRGDGLTDATGVDPQTILADGTGTPVDVNANQSLPNTFTTGGVAEFDGIANPVIALQGSGTADAPFILLHLNTTGQNNIQVAYNLRDIDGSTDNAAQAVALQYRIGSSGNFTNLPAGFVADATSGPSLATLVTPVSVTLPAGANNQVLVQVRILTTNAVGNDEWVGIDDISITGTPISGTPALSINNVSAQEGNSGTKTLNFTVGLSSPAPVGGVTFDIGTQDDSATVANNDYVAKSLAAQTIAAGNTSYAFSVTVNGDASPEADERFLVNVTNATGATIADGQGVGTILDDDTLTLIHDIQGTAETPNFVDQVKTIRGVVVGDFQGASNLNGFFVQEEQVDWDANSNTSEGIFVFAPAAPNVAVGDNVTVTGKVVNFPSPTGVTELTDVTGVTINSSGNLVAVSIISLPVPTSPAANLERYEGMLVRFTQTLVVNDNSALGQFGELSLATGKLFVPTNAIDPNDNPATGTSVAGAGNVAAVNAQQTLNNNSRIILDDGRSGSFPNPIPFIGAGTNSTIRIGDSVANLTGVMNFAFSSYRIVPVIAPVFTAANPRPNSPPSVGGSLKVASYNVENFFFTPATGRGADTAAERNRQRDKLAAALAGLNADVVGLIELEKGTQANPNAAVNELISKLNTLGVGTYAVIPTPAAVYDATNPVGTDTEIKSGIIYRTSTVAPFGGSLTDTAAAAGTYSRAPIAQVFQSKSNGALFSVVVSHQRSKTCSAGTPGEDGDQSTGQGCFNARRRLQSQALASFVSNTLTPIDPDVLLIGDYNAYGQEDPIDVFRAAGLSDLIGQYAAAASQYSFNFQGQLGRLDHAFSTSSLTSQVAGAAIWHINADEPDVFDYNTDNKPDDRYAATPFRSADHDPLLIGMNLACPQLTFSPAGLPSAMKGASYSQLISVTGGVGPHAFEVSAGTLPEGVTLAASGALSGAPTKTGVFSFTVTAKAAGGCSASRAFTLAVNEITTTILESPACLGPGSVVNIASTVTNAGENQQSSTFIAYLPENLLALPGACTANVGNCLVDGAGKITWDGTLSSGQKATINYRAQVGDHANTNDELCVTSVAKVGSNIEGSARACAPVTCRPIGVGTPVGSNTSADGQKAGSVLIFNLYTSATDVIRQNTRINITNIEPSRSTFLHLFFVDGSTCSVADYNFCLTPNQTATFLTSEFDPGTTGYVIAVAVDSTGCPTNFNYLIGDEYVKLASGHAANLGALAIPAIAGGLTSCDGNTITATLNFDDVNYKPLPLVVAVDSIPSRADVNETLIVLNSIGGNLGLDAAKLGQIQGLLYNDEEVGIGFNFSPSSCQYRGIIASSSFRTVPRIESFIPAGHSGWLKIWQADFKSAMTGAVFNYNPNVNVVENAFIQGRNLHTLRTTKSASFTIPVFPPKC